MIKSELTAALARANPHLARSDVARIIDALLEGMGEALAEGRRIELRGFGVMNSKWRKAHSACNPRSGERIDVPGRWRLAFKSSKRLRQRLNNGRAPD